MKSSTPVCPVPTEQQPLNEFQELQESWFFQWASQDLPGYLKPILILWVVNGLVAIPVAASSFSYHKHPLEFALCAVMGAMILPVLALARLYLGWNYIRGRLQDGEIFYEESGWYDGQVWEKPEEVLQRDRLIVTYQIQPLLRRLKITFGVLALLLLIGGLIWILL
ncbi:MAG: CGLD27 family protein [Oculatellaceae cyanobacterium Prado106]|jgi:hypothetical protein|nr:CGLD27 family protein [Oculatellaceae cyanobacterium Prado106]